MQHIRSRMRSARVAVFVLPLVMALFLLGPETGSAVDKSDEPTVENMLKAKQAGDLEKADRIQAILRPAILAVDNERFGHPKPPLRDGSTYRAFTWDSDRQIYEGSVEGGISLASDTSGNLYAVAARDSTEGLEAFFIYKSTDGGMNWSNIATLVAPIGSSYPVILTGSTGNKLYLFYLSSSQNGDIWMARLTQSGVHEGSYYVKVDSDTITYFSACTDLGKGDHLMVVYQKEEMGDDTPDLYTITSTDYGETWSNEVLVYAYGSHPDIAYGRNGYVYLVFEWPGGGDYDIGFIRSTDYCSPGSWVDLQTLTTDSYDNTYPKVAALHTLPDSTPYVWVAYNHKPGAYVSDLAYAYSSNGGKDWSTNLILDSSSTYKEMACDLWTERSQNNVVNVCYYQGGYAYPWPSRGDIFYRQASAWIPTDWGYRILISNHWPTQSEDGRKVCQGTYAQGDPAIMYAGKWPDDYDGDNFHDVWFDNRAWPTDVEEEMTEGELPAQFSLSANYPNPFNPETRISYFIPKASHVRLEIFNILGQSIRTLVDEEQMAGGKEVTWDGRNENGSEVASGVYLYRLEAGNLSQSKKMVLIR
jgi:hypothetical protein